LAIGSAASVIENVCCVKTACSAATASGYSDYTQSVVAGLTEASAATVSASSDSFTNDTICVSYRQVVIHLLMILFVYHIFLLLVVVRLLKVLCRLIQIVMHCILYVVLLLMYL